MKPAAALREFGVSLVGAIPWGTHLCQFYASQQDLIDILVPYFTEGLRSNEFCMWITSPPLEVDEAKQALTKAVPDLEKYIAKGQIEIISYKDWYLKGGEFNSDKVLQGWVEKESAATKNGFDGLRLTGNTFWIEHNLWNAFVDYEEAINSVIGKYNMLALCTYCLSKTTGTEVLDVVRNHIGTLLKQGDKWVLVEDALQRKKEEQELLKAKSDWEYTFNSVPDLIAILDNNHKIIRANQAMASALSATPQNCVGLHCFTCVHGTTSPLESCPHSATINDGKEHVAELHLPTLGGDYLVSTTPLRDSRGQLIGSVHVARNITERKKSEAALKTLNDELEQRIKQRTAQLTEERNRLFEVLETLPSMICLLNENHQVIFANRSFRQRFGESKGRRCYDYCFGKKEVCEFCESFLPLKTGKPHHWEVKSPDGGIIEAHDYPFRDIDGSIKILEMDLDVTAERNTQAELSRYREKLEELVEERTEKLQQTQRKLEENAALLEEYANQMEELAEQRAQKLQDAERLAAIGATAGMVGHDIRNPLQAISGDLYFAKKDLTKLPNCPEKQYIEENLASIEASVGYINKIVQDLQDFARPIRPSLQETAIDELFKELLNTINLPPNVSSQCHVDKKLRTLQTDALILRRILTNLISNAIQAMPDGGSVTLEAYIEGEDAVITVADTGMGIPDDIRPKLFMPLMTTKSKGQGFGLAVVKRMTEALGGKVTFESELGKGTVFKIILPLNC